LFRATLFGDMSLQTVSSRNDNDRRLSLAKSDWLRAGLQVLTDEGIEAVQITRLARKLEVTRGSFYWHFGDRGDLLSTMIEDWRHLNSGVMAEALSGAKSLTDGILALFTLWIDSEPFNPRLDQAVRNWARRSETIKQTVDTEDAQRIEAISAFFQKFGYRQTEAFVRARVIYFTQIGYYALGVDEPLTQRLDLLETYSRCFTGVDIDKAAAEAFRNTFIAGRQANDI